MASLRSLVRGLTVGSLCVAALLGALALLSGGDFGATEARVLVTTLLVGVASIAGLCLLTTGGTPAWPVALVGGVAAVETVLVGLALTWTRVGDSHESLSWKPFGVGAVLTVALAHAALLLVLSADHVQGLLVLTLLAVAFVTAELCYVIVVADIGEVMLRVLGVAAIGDVLGTVLVAVMSRWGDRRVSA